MTKPETYRDELIEQARAATEPGSDNPHWDPVIALIDAGWVSPEVLKREKREAKAEGWIEDVFDIGKMAAALRAALTLADDMDGTAYYAFGDELRRRITREIEVPRG